MAHFARLDEDNRVNLVVVVDNANIINSAGEESEEIGNIFLNSIEGMEGRWVQTSYNKNFRDIYASIGDIYDEENDVFVVDEEWRRLNIPNEII